MNISVPEKSSYKFDWPSFVDKKLRNCIDMNVQLELSKNVTNYAFFIDNRPIPYIDVIIKNMMLHLGTDWGLCLYIDPSNEDYYKKIAEDHFINPDQIVWIINDLSNFNAIEYSTLFMDISFWEALPGERILIFHADSWMLKSLVSVLFKFPSVSLAKIKIV